MQYEYTNGTAFYRIRNFEASWSDQDIAKFKSRLSVVGKNFANIAKFFADKVF